MFYKTKHNNGMRVLVAPMKDSKTVTVLAIFGVGSKYEKEKNAGISHFLEHMFFKGTKKRPNALAISEYLDEVGGEYNAFTSKEYTGYYAKVTPRHTERAFDMVSDILKNSKFEADEIERERGVIIEEMNMYQDAPMMYVGDLFEKLLYGDQPAGRLIIGNKKTIQSVKRKDFTGYYRKHYHAGNMVLCIAGKITKENARKMARKYFSDMRKSLKKNKVKVRESQQKPEILLHQKATDQSHLVMGFRAYDILDSRKYALNLLAAILGGGMSSRLFISVRERLGLAYYIRCNAENHTDTGYLAVHAGLDSKKIDQAIKVIISELNKIKKEGVEGKELLKAKEYVKGKTMMGLEGSDDYGMWLGLQEILTNKTEDIDKKFKFIEKVTSKDIKDIAKDIIQNKKMNMAIIGPYKSKQRFKKYFSL